jgi:hypothetical protein
MIQFLETLLETAGLRARPWTVAESEALLYSYHIHYDLKSILASRTQAECIEHYKDLHQFAQQHHAKIPDLVDAYYSGKYAIRDSQARTWRREETEELFKAVNTDDPNPNVAGRSEQECFRHYYDVVGICFERCGATREAGIALTVREYHN